MNDAKKGWFSTLDILRETFIVHARLHCVLFLRFLLIVFTASSLIATICCILMSPHFPDTTGDLMDVDEDDVYD